MSIVPVIAGAIVLLSIPLSAQQLSAEEFREQLSDYQDKEKQLREEIAQEQAAILAVKEKISASKKRVAELKQKKLDLLGVTEEHIIYIETEIADLGVLFRQRSSLSDMAVTEDSMQNNSLQQRYLKIENDPTLALPSIQKKFIPLKELYFAYFQRLEEIAARPPEEPVQENVERSAPEESSDINKNVSVTNYTVQEINGVPETLYRIAEQVYGDAYQWPRIYRANKAAIDKNYNRFKKTSSDTIYKNPSDLIFPGQVLVIPR